MPHTRLSLIPACLALLVLTALPAGAGSPTERADILSQAADPFSTPPDMTRTVLVEDGATLQRQPEGLRVGIAMPTPESGTYHYPDPDHAAAGPPGHPEGFSLWAFVFNFPEQCTPDPEDPSPDPAPVCDFDDVFQDTGAKGGAYGVTGHIVGGEKLRLTGHISTSQEALVGAPLQSPDGAEVHLAVAPHGEVDGDKMPAQIKQPVGPPGIWWVALFK